jgi:hypothetical protein
MKPFGLKSWIFTFVAAIPVILLGILYDQSAAFWWIVGVGAWSNVVGYMEGRSSRPKGTDQ